MPTQKFQPSASWSIDNWPPETWPNTVERARYVIRAYRASLLTAGALARVGRELIIFGAKYQRWLESHAANVPGYEVAPNRKDSPESANAAAR
jgi:hypothetical protein